MGTTTAKSWRFALDVFDNRCAYCGVSDHPLHRDHVIPLSRGGRDIPSNVVPACDRCNSSKGDQDFRFWMRQRGLDIPQFVVRWFCLRRAT